MKFQSNILTENSLGFLLKIKRLFISSCKTWSLILFFGLVTACSGTKQLPKGEKLYTGASIQFKTTDKVNKRPIKVAAEESFRPEPNKSYFGMRPQLWLYMAAGENPKSKFKKWFRKNGEAPVLLSQIKPSVTAAVIDAKLFNLGIFNSHTEFRIVEKKRTAHIIYSSYIHQPYTVDSLVYDVHDDSINRLIMNAKESSLIKNGENYNLEVLQNERLRIDELLKNKGYFYFSPDYLLFKADTSTIKHSISFRLTLKDSIPENALIAYQLRNIYVNQNYSLNDRKTINANDTQMIDDNIFIGTERDMKIKPEVILKSIYLRKNEIYSRQNHAITLNRLMSLGNFKFVQVKFEDSDSTTLGLLDATVLMTPMSRHTFRAELDLVTKSNKYTGPQLNLSVLNRNTFKGAELLNLNMAGSFEAQLSRMSENLYSYSWNPDIELTFPRFIVPFKLKPTNSLYVPKTRFVLSYSYMNRVNYFAMNTFKFGYGFKWKDNIKNEHEFNPVNISYTSIGNRSATFDQLLLSNPFLEKSYEEQFITGANYSFTYNEQLIPGKKIQYYINLNVETAGNVLSLAKLIGGEKVSPEQPLKVIGSVYSQYAKMSIDGRATLNLSDRDKLALRGFAGVAHSYGNSSVLPYSKQFFSGGPNSIRAFQINSLGPGTYHQQNINRYLQSGGDIKLEANAEYRFNIYKYFKGALFVDAGNVWLQKSNPSDIGTPFSFTGFMNELAMGAGAGLRVDVSFFVLRFDLAIPLCKPWLPDNQRWVTNAIDFTDATWRRENLMLNIAIGYPF